MFIRLSFRLAPKLCLITSRSGETDGIEERGIIELLRLLITAEPWGFKYLPTKKFWGLRSEALRWLRMIHLVRERIREKRGNRERGERRKMRDSHLWIYGRDSRDEGRKEYA